MQIINKTSEKLRSLFYHYARKKVYIILFNSLSKLLTS
ncbi:hypothetical protein HMPREF9413_0043 [Paenibacillus sp. HGF7]|nr:hypothetical protein HMPREF9413_0043 [Paenibacillus sp. HGF7]